MAIDTAALDERMADEYRAARERMQGIGRTLAADDARRIVPACPAWDVHALFSHVAGVSGDLAAARFPQGDTQAWVDAHVTDRRDRPFDAVVDEWSQAGPAFEAMIAAKPHRWWGLTYDTIVHELDLRGALGDRSGRDTDAVRFGALLGLRLVEADLATHGLPALRAVVDGEEHVAGGGEPELTLEASSFEVLRLLGSRRTIDELRAASFRGDLDRYLPGLVHMELPATTLGE
jgi:uncharacterized protein (TIGR03083 family)